MRRTPFSLAPALALASLLACSPDTTTAPRAPSLSAAAASDNSSRPDLNVVRADLLATDAAYSRAAAGQTAARALLAAFDDDVYYLLAGAPLAHGRQQAAETFALLPIFSDGSITWNAVRADVSGDGTLGYTFGYATRTFTDGSVRPAEYIAVWHQAKHGDWKIAAFVLNGSLPIPASTVPPAGFETPTYARYEHFPHGSADAALASIKAADQAFSDAAYPDVGQAFVDFAAPDVAKIAVKPIVYGRDGIRGLFGPADPSSRLAWSPIDGAVAGTNDLGFTVGTGTSADLTSGQTLGWFKYITVWKRQPTGEWLFVQDGGNAAPAP